MMRLPPEGGSLFPLIMDEQKQEEKRILGEYGILLLLAAGALLLLAGMMVYSNYKNRELFLREAEQNWGKVPESGYTADRLESLAVYGKEKCSRESFSIDEITWKDLDMDRVFQIMNHTVSAPGEEYLMYLLRTPKLEEEKLRERDQMACWAAENGDKRRELQFILSRVSKKRTHSIGEDFISLKSAPEVSEKKHGTLGFLAALCLAVMLFFPVGGFFLFLGVSCINVADYYGGRDREAAAVYLGCFRTVLQMIQVSGKVGQLPWEEIRKSGETMKKARENLRIFWKNSHWLFGINSVSGSLEGVLADLVRMVFHVDLIWYNKMLREIRRHGEDVEILMDHLGELDCAIAIASFREMLPVWSRPSFCGEMEIRAEQLYHPLLTDPVANSFQTGGGMLITGSNASGKSTFLKSAALNAVLAQTAVTCAAASYRAPLCRIYTSMSLSDNLEGGESYFMVEIRSLKRILDAARLDGPLLCAADEVLRGTNTIERVAASSEILRSLRRKNVFCLAATHDMELTYLLEKWYENYHFDEEINGADIFFSYEIKKGRAASRNAIRLLAMMGYGEDIIEAAEKTAREFHPAIIKSPESAEL